MIGRIMTFIYDDGEKSEFKNNTNFKFLPAPVDLRITERSLFITKSKFNDDMSKYPQEFMWKVLENLLLRSSLGSNSDNFLYKKDGVEIIIPKEEIKKFAQNNSFVRYSVSNLSTAKNIKSIAKIYAYICFDNQETSLVVLQHINEVLNEKDTRYFVNIFKFIFYICKINDNPILQQNRVLIQL